MPDIPPAGVQRFMLIYNKGLNDSTSLSYALHMCIYIVYLRICASQASMFANILYDIQLHGLTIDIHLPIAGMYETVDTKLNMTVSCLFRRSFLGFPIFLHKLLYSIELET